MSIEERAEAWIKTTRHYDKDEKFALFTGYEQGATDQQKIDIDNACKWIMANLPNTTDDDILYDNHTICDRNMIVEQFKKAMEEAQ